ncbi:MAG TPA: MMPL family transporter, partial [Pseudonocardiaceae bacterium]
MRKQPLTMRVVQWSARHPWTAITSWTAFVALCFAVGTLVGTHNATSADYRVGEAGRAEAIADAGGLTPPAIEKILITSAHGPLDITTADTAAAQVGRRMATLPAVSTVDPAVHSPGNKAVMVAVTVKGDARDAGKVVGSLLDQTSAVQAQYPGLTIAETGNASVSHGLDAQRGSDLLLSEEITLPITLIILLLVFGSVLAAGIPVLLALLSIVGAMGLYAIATHVFPDAGVGDQLIVLMGMAVGVDYSLFYIRREREERQRSGGTISPEAAVRLAAATAGRAILMSGFAVLITAACLFLADDVIFTSLAVGTMIVVLVSVVSSLTVLPALLVKLGGRVDRRRVRSDESRLWAALLRPAMRRPVVTLTVATLAMLACAVPALHLRLGTPSDDGFSRSVVELRTGDQLAALFPAQRAANLVAIHDNSGDIRTTLTHLNDLVLRDPRFAEHVSGKIRVAADGRTGTLQVFTSYPVSSPEALTALARLRDTLVPEALRGDYGVSGDVARNIDYVSHENQRLPWVLGGVLLVTLLMMLVIFRSLVIAAIGVLCNLLSAAAAFGALVGV